MSVTTLDRGWSVRPPLGPFAAAQGGDAEPVLVRLPHDALRDTERSADAESKGASAYWPRGAFTYLHTLDVPPAWAGGSVQLEVEGAFRRAQVFLNDELAGNRADGYARFFVDLTPYLRWGAANEVRIEVRSGEDSRWYSGCGLHRPVRLHVDDPLHVVPDGVSISTSWIDDDRAAIEVATTILNLGATTETTRLRTTIAGPDGVLVDVDSVPVTVAPRERTEVRQRLYVEDPSLWHPDHPHLYEASVELDRGDAGDGDGRTALSSPHTTAFGIRTITVDPHRGLRLNGQEVLLRGACVHHDNGPLGAAAIGRAEERRIELLREAGFNAIRAAHNPVSSAMLDACDRLGMLVMDEAFDQWTRAKTAYDPSFEFPQWWRQDLAAMVAKDRNHPSVILYSIGNEIAEVGTPHGARLTRAMAEQVRALDPTRPVTNGVNLALAVLDELSDLLAADAGLNELLADMSEAMNALATSEAATRRTEESSAALDVLGLNYAEGRYASDATRFPHRVLVGSETFAGRIGTLWPMVLRYPHVIGDFTWTGWDYLGEVGIGATAYAEEPGDVAALEREFPFLTAWCGDLDLTGHRRPASYHREIVFGLRTDPHMAVRRPQHHDHTITMQSPWAWSDSVASWTWTGHEGAPVVVEVSSASDQVALLLDGEEVARAEVGVERPFLAILETIYRPGELTAVASIDGVETGRCTLATAGTPRLVAVADRPLLVDSAQDLAFVSLELRDLDGVLDTAARTAVTVEITGPGELAGMCSANPRTAERFCDPTWQTFDGRALAVIRPTGPGTVEITASSTDFGTSSIQLEVSAGDG